MSVLGVLLASVLSFQGLTPADSRDGLANPERGWRFEIGVGRLAEDPVKFRHVRDQWPFPRFVRDGVTVSQAYCYLTQFVDGPVSDEKIAALEADFARARREGVKFLLRFAYEFSDELRFRTREAPTAERILAHIEQLKPVVRRNIDVIYCLQTGWVGLWGEFHSSARGVEKDPEAVKRIVAATLDMLPPERKTMMRRIAYKEGVLKALGAEGEANATNGWTQAATARIGFFNDGTLANWWDGGTFTEEPYADGDNREYERVHREGLYTPVDGELFWTGQYSHPVFADGYRAIDRFSYQHYTTFSLVHGHSLLDQSTKPWTIDGWKVTPVTAEALKFFGVDFDPAYFEGVPHRTAYEFIRDHLGYRIALKEATLPDGAGRGGTVRLTLRNYGFAPPVNPRFPVLVAADGTGACREIPVDFDCRTLMPGKDVSFSATVPPCAGERLALWLPDAAPSLRYDSRFAIRLATRLATEVVGGRLLHYLEPADDGVAITGFDWTTGKATVSNLTAACEYRRLDCAWSLTIGDDGWSQGSCDLGILTPGAEQSVKVPYRRLPPTFAPVGYGVKRLTLRILDNGRELARRQFTLPGKPQLFPETPARFRRTDGLLLSRPYLQNMGTRGFTVCVETRRADDSLKLKWGTVPEKTGTVPNVESFSFKKASFSGTYLATARLEGLSPNTRVWYEVAGRKGETTTWTEGDGDFTCAIFGDFQSGLSNGPKWWDWEEDPFLCGERMFEDMAKSGCAFAVGTGDVADTGDYRKELRPLVIDRTCGVLGSKIPFFMAFGNHDSLHPENHFFFVNPTSAPGLSSFAFFRNNCLFVCIDDAEVGNDKVPGSAQLRTWFEGLMKSDAARQAKFRFVFQHVPVYVEAFGNCNRWLADLYEKYGVDCVFSGDHHGYERIVRGKTRQVVNGCMGYFDHGRPDTKLLVNWYGAETVAGGHAGMPKPCTWRFQAPGRPGVLGAPAPVYEGLLPGYATLEVKGDTATWTLIGFNADGSKIGPVDSFTMKAGKRPDAPKGLALERYCYCVSPKGKWLLKYTLTGKGGRVVERCEDDEFCSSKPIVEGDVVGVVFTAADGRQKTCRVLPDNAVSETVSAGL